MLTINRLCEPLFLSPALRPWLFHSIPVPWFPVLWFDWFGFCWGLLQIDPRAFHETSGLDKRYLPKSIDDKAATNLELNRCAAGMIFSGEIDFDVMCCPLDTPAYVPVRVGSEQCPHGAVVAFKECRKREYYKILVSQRLVCVCCGPGCLCVCVVFPRVWDGGKPCTPTVRLTTLSVLPRAGFYSD